MCLTSRNRVVRSRPGGIQSPPDATWRAGWTSRALAGREALADGPPHVPPVADVQEHGPARGDKWIKRQMRRRLVVDQMARAGAYVRANWSISESSGETRSIGGGYQVDHRVYLDGPARGLPVVDPWKTGEAVAMCSQSWGVQLRYREGRGDMTALALPHRCGRGTVCPVCSAISATKRALALQEVAGQLMENGYQVVHATFTQRARPGEPLQDALTRLRDTWRRMTTGRPGRRWRAVVAGVYWGDEAVRSWPGKDRWDERRSAPRPPEDRQYWHVHRHAILVFVPGIDAAQQEGPILDEWMRASRAASGTEWAARYAAFESGRWWVPVDTVEGLYQAAKYPTTVHELGTVAMAEYLAVAYGRRWHHGSGVLQSVMRMAEEIEEARAIEAAARDAAEATDEEPSTDLGIPVSTLQPGRGTPGGYGAPDLAVVDDMHADEYVVFRLTQAALAEWYEAIRVALADVGAGIELVETTTDGYTAAVVPAGVVRRWILHTEELCKRRAKPPDSSSG